MLLSLLSFLLIPRHLKVSSALNFDPLQPIPAARVLCLKHEVVHHSSAQSVSVAHIALQIKCKACNMAYKAQHAFANSSAFRQERAHTSTQSLLT